VLLNELPPHTANLEEAWSVRCNLEWVGGTTWKGVLVRSGLVGVEFVGEKISPGAQHHRPTWPMVGCSVCIECGPAQGWWSGRERARWSAGEGRQSGATMSWHGWLRLAWHASGVGIWGDSDRWA
jgi:hypothetical protein